MRSLSIGLIACTLLLLMSASIRAQDRGSVMEKPMVQRQPTGSPISPAAASSLVTQGATRLFSRQKSSESTLPLYEFKTQEISFKDFLQDVERSNLDYAAQRYSVSIAQAQVIAARVFPDPTFQTLYGGDVSGEKQPSDYAGNISETILLGGKIGARTAVAQSNLNAAQAQLEDFFRNLRANAANSFIDGLSGWLNFKRQRRSLETLEQLVSFNQERLRVGDISEVDLLQSRVAALQSRGGLLAAVSTWQQTLVGLALMLGRQRQETLLRPIGNLELHERALVLDDLIARALAQRSDVVAARRAYDAARAQYRLAQANRLPDLTLGLNYQHATRSTAFIDPSPAWDSLAITVSMPIPFSDLNKGALQGAMASQLQAERAVQGTELHAETDVRQAYARYTLANAAIDQYSGELIKDAERVYQAKLYSYQRGGASLLEVLDAEHAINDIYQAYYAALNEQAKSLVALEQSSGIWDIEF